MESEAVRLLDDSSIHNSVLITASNDDIKYEDSGIERINPNIVESTDEVLTEVSTSFTLDDLHYGLNAYHSILMPVSITLLLSSFSVVMIKSDYIQTDDNNNTFYNIQNDQELTNTQKFEESVINAVIIITLIGLLTFFMVFLFYMRCTKVITGYMIFSSSLLLIFMGSLYLQTVLNRLEIPFDIYSFVFIVYNFAIVGIYSIFFGDGIPKIVTQGYLICTSVLLSWQLSRFDEWTTWSLLFFLALYDLFAVLTPCGPLNALVSLMQQRPNEQVPGLLYETSVILPSNSVRINNRPRQNFDSRDLNIEPRDSINESEIELEDIRKDSSKKKRSYRGLSDLAISDSNAENELLSNLEDNTNIRNQKMKAKNESKKKKKSRSNKTVRTSRKQSLKLGLGDFVFYSVLVSRAAMKGFIPFFCCFVTILWGLGFTMILLSIYKMALPALPISILFGISVYFLSVYFVVPFVEEINSRLIFL